MAAEAQPYTADLHHPEFVGVWRDANNVRRTCGEVDEESYVVGDEATDCACFNAEEFLGGLALPVGLQKRRPFGSGTESGLRRQSIPLARRGRASLLRDRRRGQENSVSRGFEAANLR